MTETAVRQRIAELTHQATDGRVSPADALMAGASLSALGLDSLGFLRLIDAVELEYGVEIDLDSAGPRLDTVDDLIARLPQGGAR
jgi:acyl carrier protein